MDLRWEIHFTKRLKYKKNVEGIKVQLKKYTKVATRNNSMLFNSRVIKVQEPEEISTDNGILYIHKGAISVIRKNPRNPTTSERNFQRIFEYVKKAAEKDEWSVCIGQAPPTQDNDYPLNNDIDDLNKSSISASSGFALVDFQPPPLTVHDMEVEFAGIYDREPHIRVIHDAISDSVENSKRRNHILLYGEPASCKTELIRRFKLFYEKGRMEDSVLKILDKQTMTKAGLEEFLRKGIIDKMLPKIVAIEEIEKGPMDNLNGLLSVMGTGYFSKTNARIGDFSGECPITVIATCNDEKFVRDFQRGALWSRFSIRLYNVKPDRVLMERILMDLCPHRDWVKAAITFSYDVWPQLFSGEIYDKGNPRGIKSLLAGRHRLVDGGKYGGTWQDDLIQIEKSKEKEIK